MKKNNLKYFFKMIVKTCLLILPLFAIAFSAFAPQREKVTATYDYLYDDLGSKSDYIMNVYEGVTLTYYVTDDVTQYTELDFYCSYLCVDGSIIFNYYDRYFDYDTYMPYIYLDTGGQYLDVEYTDGVASFEFYDRVTFVGYEYIYDYDDLILYRGDVRDTPVINANIVKTNPTMESELIDFSNQFLKLPINQWYKNLINAIGLTLPTNLMLIVFIYPLYILWIEVFDLIVHIFMVLPKLAHKLLGEED